MDEFILRVSPCALGSAMSLFAGVGRVELALSETRKFDSGNLILRYQTRWATDTRIAIGFNLFGLVDRSSGSRNPLSAGCFLSISNP